MRLFGRIIYLIVIVGFVSAPLAAQAARLKKRVALVIGNANYQYSGKLVTPPNDVRGVAEKLKAAGFIVFEGHDLDKRRMVALIRRFLQELDKKTVSLFYYSGHAVQVSGTNYLIPVDARLQSAYDLEQETFMLNNLLKYMESMSSAQLVFLDACRNNPFEGRNFLTGALTRGASSTSGLAAMKAGVGTLISYSTAPGRVAYDGAGKEKGAGKMSPFSGALVKHMLQPATEIRQLLSLVRRDVIRATKGLQVPWENSSLLDNFYFVSPRKAPVVKPVHEADVGAGVKNADLQLPIPFQKAGGHLRVKFTRLPARGRLVLDNRTLGTKDVIQAADLARVRFDGANISQTTVEIVGYRVSDDWGNNKDGLIIIKAVQNDREIRAIEARKKSNLIRLASLQRSVVPGLSRPFKTAIGVGPVPLGIRLARKILKPGQARIEVIKAPATGQLRLANRVLGDGSSFDLVNLAKLSYRPVVGSENKTVEAKLVVATQSVRSPVMPVKFVPAIHPCDRLAGQPFDLQGVAPGVYAHRLDGARAEKACLEAMADYPGTARFIYQLGRAKLALGQARKALELFELAAKLGHIRADHAIGVLYANGAIGDVDERRANAHFAVAALKGDTYAIYSYGKRIFYGRGVKQDRTRGLAFMLQAAEMGHTFAMNELGRIFRLGIGVKKDPKRALRFSMASALRNDIYGYNNLAVHFLNGIGVKRDETKALAWFLKANRGKHPEAGNNIGRMYENGWGVPRNLEIAAGWYEKSAMRGSAWAANNRAWLALNGPQQLRDSALAVKYFALSAALQRNEPSKQALALLGKINGQAKRKAVQLILGELGYPVRRRDGHYNKATRRAIRRYIKKHGNVRSDDTDRLLASLAKSWWVKNKPRFDLF